MKSSFASYQCCSGWMIFSGVMALWKIFLSALPHLHQVLHFDETWQEASVWGLVLRLTNAVPVEGFKKYIFDSVKSQSTARYTVLLVKGQCLKK